MEQRIGIERMEEAVNLFGSFDENIRLLEAEFQVQAVNRGGEIVVSGEPENVMLAVKAVQALLTLSGKGETITDQHVRYVIGLVRSGQAERISELTQDVICITSKGRPVKPKTIGQKEYVNAIMKKTVTIGVGPAGTGKTYLAVAAAVAAFRDKQVNRIILTRPAVESAELQFTHPAAGEPVAVFDTTAGVFKAVLFPEQAPQAYDNFVGLVQAGYYNGLTVTRVEQDFVVEAGQGADGKGTTIWNGSRYPAEATDKLHHYSGALCMAADSSGQCASVFYIMSTLPGGDSITQELTDQMNSAGYRAEVVSAYQTVGGAPYLDYTDTVLGQVYEGMDVVDTIAQAAVDENQKPTETITINSVSIETYQAQ